MVGSSTESLHFHREGHLADIHRNHAVGQGVLAATDRAVFGAVIRNA